MDFILGLPASLISFGWLLINLSSLPTSFQYVPATRQGNMQCCTLSAFCACMVCQILSSLTKGPSLLPFYRSNLMTPWEPIWFIVQHMIHKSMVRWIEWIQFLRICSEHVWWTTGIVGINACLCLSSLITTITKRASRWHLSKHSIAAAARPH
jgi:hypothetical protein